MAAPKQVPDEFPGEKLKTLFSGFWDEKISSPLKKPSPVKTTNTVFALQPELSSQQAVGVLVSCVGLLGFRPSVDVIEKGGYPNKAAFVSGLLTKVAAEFSEKKGASQKPTIVQKGEQNANAIV